MSELNNEIVIKLTNEIKLVEKKLLQAVKDTETQTKRELVAFLNQVYSQLESLSWLQRRLTIKGQLPPLRGWAASPDVLLRLHSHIMASQPNIVVECGSGASTLVIADALRQNGKGKLISLEHIDFYGAQTLATLQAENLEKYVDLRVGDLEVWDGKHLNPANAEKTSKWYPEKLLLGIESVDLLWVDGPPGATCLFSRFPALPAFAKQLTANAEVWMDDTIRQEEKDICQSWAQDYAFDLKYFSLEKGLGVLIKKANI